MTAQLRALDYASSPSQTVWAEQRAPAWHLLTAGLVLTDVLALIGAFGSAYAVRFDSGLPIFREGSEQPYFYIWVAVWALPIWLGIFMLYRLYDRHYLFAGFQEYTRVAGACTVGALAIIVISFFSEIPSIARAWLVLVWLLSAFAVCGARFAARRVVRWLRRRGHLVTLSVIVGCNDEGSALAEQLLANPSSGARVIGFVQSTARGEQAGNGADLPILGGLGDLGEIVRRWGVSEVIVATTALTRDELLELYRRFGREEGVELRLSSGLFEILTTGVRVQEISGVPLMTLDRVRITGIDAALKAVLDYASALLGLLVLSPIMLLIALLIKLDNRGPVLHRRRVLGQTGKPFDAFKFCTMIPDRRTRQVPIPFPDRRRSDKTERDPRVTRIGAFLRRTSLDELPQLLNVLRGEMSLVGPRMIVSDEAGRYGKWQLNLLTVKPGITGPWQVRGRGTIHYEERIRLSMEYIRNYSIWLDLEILLRTVPAVISGKGAF